jgi:hypothetical protein
MRRIATEREISAAEASVTEAAVTDRDARRAPAPGPTVPAGRIGTRPGVLTAVVGSAPRCAETAP